MVMQRRLRQYIEYYAQKNKNDRDDSIKKSEELKRTLEMVTANLKNGETRTCSRKGVLRTGESCRFNNNCTYPNCLA